MHHCLVSLCALLAVAFGPLAAQAPPVRDSAGIRIVMNPAFASAPQTFVFRAEPIFSVGGLEDDPDNEFISNQGYLRGVFLSNGTLAVTDEWRVQFFGPNAKRIGIVGTKGSGPEEFRYLMGVCRTVGDTIVTYDSRNARNVVISPSQRIVRTFRSVPSGSITFSSCFDDGTIVLSHSEFDRASGASTTHYVRARLDGSVVSPLFSLAPARYDMVTQAENATATAGKRFYHGLPEGSQITAYNNTGKPVLIIRYADKGQRITDGDALNRIAYALPGNGVKPTDAQVAAARADALEKWKSRPHAEFWPTHGRIHVDDQGRLWVNQYRRNSKSLDVWVAFAPNGQMIGKLVLPEGRKEVIGFANNAILIRTADSDGAAHLQLHAITKR